MAAAHRRHGALALLAGTLCWATSSGAAGASFAQEWLAATVEGCLAALEQGHAMGLPADGPSLGARLGLDAAPDLSLSYSVPSEVWRAPDGRFALGTAILPGADDTTRHLCEAESLAFLTPRTVNTTYAGFLDWAEAAAADGQYRFLGTRFNEDVLTGLVALEGTRPTARGRLLEVVFVAQPAEGRVSFSAVEMRRAAP